MNPIQVFFPDELTQGRQVGFAIFYDDNLVPIYDKLVWESEEHDRPTEEEFFAAYERALGKCYKFKRKDEYPSIGDQLDALFHAGVFPEEMASKIQAVKDKYPKPEAGM